MNELVVRFLSFGSRLKFRSLLLLTVCFMLFFLRIAVAKEPPNITAEAAMVIDVSDNKILYELNADKRLYPASTTKMMTCLLALEHYQRERLLQGIPCTNNIVKLNFDKINNLIKGFLQLKDSPSNDKSHKAFYAISANDILKNISHIIMRERLLQMMRSFDVDLKDDEVDSRLVLDLRFSRQQYFSEHTPWSYNHFLASCYYNPERLIQVNYNAENIEDTDCQRGSLLTVQELMFQMMLESDNGAAVMLGYIVGGGNVDYFVHLMNQKAKLLGMSDTHFVNPNGLPNENHYSTARDLAMLALKCMDNSEFREIVSTKEAMIYYLAPEETIGTLENTNRLLWKDPECVGIKTGWTEDAGGCLAATFKRGEKEILVIVLHATTEYSRFTDAANLCDYVFEDTLS